MAGLKDISPAMLKRELKRALAARERTAAAAAGMTAAAVLLPLYYKEGEYHLLFVKRAEGVSRHQGQIAFPGGVCEEADRGLAGTACRECQEEVGVASCDIEVLGKLDDVYTLSSGYLITPVVGFVTRPCSFRIDPREIAAVIEIPLAALLDAGQTEERQVGGRAVTAYRYRYGETVIWGATARILHQFIGILKSFTALETAG